MKRIRLLFVMLMLLAPWHGTFAENGASPQQSATIDTRTVSNAGANAGAVVNQQFSGGKQIPFPQAFGTSYPTTAPLFGQWTRPSWQVYEALNEALDSMSERRQIVSPSVAVALHKDLPGDTEYTSLSFTRNVNFFRMGDYLFCRYGVDQNCVRNPSGDPAVITLPPITDHVELRGGALLGFVQASTHEDKKQANPYRMRTDVRLFVAQGLGIPPALLNSGRVHILYLPQGSAVNAGYKTDGNTTGIFASIAGFLSQGTGALGASYTTSEAQAMNAPQVGHQYLVFADWARGPYINIDLRPKPPVEQPPEQKPGVVVTVNNNFPPQAQPVAAPKPKQVHRKRAVKKAVRKCSCTPGSIAQVN